MTQLTAALIAACTGAAIAQAEKYAAPLAQAMDAFKISQTPLRIAMFLANVGVESERLQRTTENLNYRTSALIAKFGRHRISIADAEKYGRNEAHAANQEMIANCIYGGKWGSDNLGNDKVGDGWKYRGHGLFQTTGRFNTAKVRDRLRLKFPALKVPDFEANPDALSEPLWAAMSAGDYWDMRELAGPADAGQFDRVCDLLNIGKPTEQYGDAHGFADRLAIFKTGKVALRIA